MVATVPPPDFHVGVDAPRITNPYSSSSSSAQASNLRALDERADRGVGIRAARKERLDEHGQVGTHDDLHIGRGLGGHHGLVEGRAAEKVAEDDDAVGLLAHGGDLGVDELWIVGRLVDVERNDLEALLPTRDELERACETGGELAVTRENETDHCDSS